MDAFAMFAAFLGPFVAPRAALPGANGLGALAAFTLAYLACWHRARIEEQALLAALGEPYARFLATRRRFIPFIA